MQKPSQTTQSYRDWPRTASTAWWRWWQQNGLLLAAVFLAGAAAHCLMWVNGLQNPDSLWLGSDYHVADAWELSLGRWGLVLVDWLRGGVNHPVVSGLSMLFFYALGGVLLVGVLGVEQRAARILVPLCIVLAPATLTTESYLFCSTAYALAFCLAVAAVRCVQCLPAWWGSAAGALCLMFGLSIYQSNIGVATGLSAMLLLTAILREPQQLKQHGVLALRLGAMGIGGVGAYYGILQLLLRLNHLQMAEYKGANSVGVGSVLRSLGSTVPTAYTDFFSYFFTREIATNAYQVRPLYAALFALALVLLAVRLWQLLRSKQPVAFAAALVLLVLLPLAAAFIDVITAETTLIMLTVSGLLPVVPFLISLPGRIPLPRRLAGAATVLTMVLGCLLLRGYVLQLGTDSLVMLNNERRTVALASRIVADLEENEDYLAGLPLMIVGRPEQGNYPQREAYFFLADPMPQQGMFFNSRHANAVEWQHVLRQYLGVTPNYCTQEQVLALCAGDAYHAMPNYPAPGSIATIDGCVVVKIAEEF